MRAFVFGNDGAGVNGRLPSARGDREQFHTRPRLEAILDRERARADRTGRELSFVVFRILQERSQFRAYRRLARVVMRRARITDDVGHFENGSVAAVLPDTPGGSAWKFAHDIVEILGRRALSVEVRVYAYPSDRSGHPRAPQSQGSTGRTPEPAESAHPIRHLQAAPRWDMDSKAWSVAPEVATEPLEPLCLSSIPGWKQLLDLVGAGIALVILSPVLLVAGLAVKLSSPGPAMFVQLRAGRGGRPFRMYKFRTMYVDAEHRKAQLSSLSEQDGPAFKIKDDPRITRMGRILRKTSIDELPQLWNVLKGEMSLVGPRPLPCDEAEACHRWHQRRHDVLPGLTCIWQVRGRSSVSFEEWMRMDVGYIRRQGLLRDLLILLQTIPAVLMRRGAC
jgi:lipopolysaccharide/colanic/teichoic acid biosynthesis glycosyltransferase